MNRKLSLKTKTILIFIASLVGMGFFIAVVSAFYLNALKEHLLDNAMQLAKEQGEQAAKEIHNLIESENIDTLKDIKDKNKFQSQLQVLFKKNKDIVIAAFIDKSGKIVVEQVRKGEDKIEVIEPGETIKTEIPSNANEDWEIEVKKIEDNLQQIELPIKKGEVPIGYLKYSISHSKVYQKMIKTSKIFTYQIILLIISLIVLLAVIFYLLWKVFNRHITVLEEKDKLDKMAYVGTLASGLAHEIRNPLNVMKINLDVISDDIENAKNPTDKNNLNSIKLISGQVQHLNNILNSFLGYAISNPIEKNKEDIVYLVKETIEFFENDMKKKNISCILDAPDKFFVNIDRSKIQQVLNNIILNAIQAMTGSEKKIFINIFKKDEKAVLTVTDTGEGFPQKNMDEIFKVFFTTKEKGSGFGLAIAKKIIEEHGGKIEALNVEPKGARITITLPV